MKTGEFSASVWLVTPSGTGPLRSFALLANPAVAFQEE